MFHKSFNTYMLPLFNITGGGDEPVRHAIHLEFHLVGDGLALETGYALVGGHLRCGSGHFLDGNGNLFRLGQEPHPQVLVVAPKFVVLEKRKEKKINT